MKSGVIVFKRGNGGVYVFKYPWLAILHIDGKKVFVYATQSLRYMIFVSGNQETKRMGWKQGLKLFKQLKEEAEHIEIHPEFYRMQLNLLDKSNRLCYNNTYEKP